MDDKMQEFAKELCALLRKHKLSSFSGEFSSGFDHKPCFNKYNFNWSSGRHEAEAGEITIVYTENHSIQIPWKYEKEDTK